MFKKKQPKKEPENYVEENTEQIEAPIGDTADVAAPKPPPEEKVPEHIRTLLEDVGKWAGVYHPNNFPDVAKAEGLTLLLAILSEQKRTNELLEKIMETAP